MRFRRMLAIASLAAFVVAGSQLFFFRAVTDRDEISRALREHPDRGVEAYPHFVRKVRERTEPGDTVAILYPETNWDPGYAYAFMRGNYLLPGREVIPLVDPDGSLHPERIGESEWIAAFETTISGPDLQVALETADGVLYRRDSN